MLRIQFDDSVICRFYSITFREYVIAGTTLLDYTNLFSPSEKEWRDNTKVP